MAMGDEPANLSATMLFNRRGFALDQGESAEAFAAVESNRPDSRPAPAGRAGPPDLRRCNSSLELGKRANPWTADCTARARRGSTAAGFAAGFNELRGRFGEFPRLGPQGVYAFPTPGEGKPR